MTRARRSLAAIVGLLALATTWSHPASGDGGVMCAPGPEDPRVGLQRAAAAFIGTMSAYRTDGSVTATATLVVDRVLKGDLPSTIEARVDRSCPLNAELDQERGFLMSRRGSEWIIEPDGAVAPDVLERASRPRPAPEAGRAVLVAKVAT